MAKYLFDTKERSLAATIAHMTARDGMPFQVFCSSPDLRKALLAMGFSDLPKSPTSIHDTLFFNWTSWSLPAASF